MTLRGVSFTVKIRRLVKLLLGIEHLAAVVRINRLFKKNELRIRFIIITALIIYWQKQTHLQRAYDAFTRRLFAWWRKSDILVIRREDCYQKILVSGYCLNKCCTLNFQNWHWNLQVGWYRWTLGVRLCLVWTSKLMNKLTSPRGGAYC